jgi:hypothetical protein
MRERNRKCEVEIRSGKSEVRAKSIIRNQFRQYCRNDGEEENGRMVPLKRR